MWNKIEYIGIIILAIILTSGCASLKNDSENLFVAKISELDKIKIGNGNINNYFRDLKDVSFGEIEIEQSGVNYYLLSSDRNTKDKYAFELKKIGNKLYLDKYRERHSCSMRVDEPCIFLKNTESKIIGCKSGCDHTISIATPN